MKNMNNKLSEKWRELCNSYLLQFCDKHEFPYEPDMWVADNPGTIVMVGDMYVSMDDLRYDIDNNIDPEKFEKWYWKSVELYELAKQKYMNYRTYCIGAPDEWPEERLEKMRKAKKRLEEEKERFRKLINEYKDYKFPEF